MSSIRVLVFLLLLNQDDYFVLAAVRHINNDGLNEGQQRRVKRGNKSCVEINPDQLQPNMYFMCRRDSSMEKWKNECGCGSVATSFEPTLSYGDMEKNIPVAETGNSYPEKNIDRSYQALLQKLSNGRESIFRDSRLLSIPIPTVNAGHEFSITSTVDVESSRPRINGMNQIGHSSISNTSTKTLRAWEDENLNLIKDCKFTLPTMSSYEIIRPEFKLIAEERYNHHTADNVFEIPKLNFTPDEFNFLQKFSKANEKQKYSRFHQPEFSFTHNINDPVMQTFYASIPPEQRQRSQKFLASETLPEQQFFYAGNLNGYDRSVVSKRCNTNSNALPMVVVDTDASIISPPCDNNNCNSCTPREYQPVLIALPCSHYGLQSQSLAQPSLTIHEVTPNYVGAATTDYPLIDLVNPLTTLSLPNFGLFRLGLPPALRLGGIDMGLNILRPPFLGSVHNTNNNNMQRKPNNNGNLLKSNLNTLSNIQNNKFSETQLQKENSFPTTTYKTVVINTMSTTKSEAEADDINLSQSPYNDEVPSNLENESRKAYKSLYAIAKSFMHEAKTEAAAATD